VHDRLIGDPLDIEMYQATNWSMIEPEHKDKEHVVLANFTPQDTNGTFKSWSLDVLKRFEFSSALQRMSVVVKSATEDELIAFVKGSPEMIQTLCDSQSVPQDYLDVLETYTREGLRVLSLAYKYLPGYEATDLDG
jgi:magnesium-transporting ATPase (P-type)